MHVYPVYTVPTEARRGLWKKVGVVVNRAWETTPLRPVSLVTTCVNIKERMEKAPKGKLN